MSACSARNGENQMNSIYYTTKKVASMSNKMDNILKILHYPSVSEHVQV